MGMNSESIKKMGRPTLYGTEIIAKSQEYLENYHLYEELIPSQAGLALHVGVSRETLRKWGKDADKSEFIGILERIQAKQEVLLVSKGLGGEFNSNICKLVMGKHGYHDKQDLESQSTFKFSIDKKDAGNL